MYNLSLSNQRNNSKCVEMSFANGGINCSQYYTRTSFPNFIGDTVDTGVRDWFNNFDLLETMVASLSKHNLLECYAHLKELFCYVFFPKCDPVTKQAVHLCRETCLEVENSCKGVFLSLFHNITSLSYVSSINWQYIINTGPSDWWNCSYLPSADGNIPCFFKPVTCGEPPNVPNAFLRMTTEMPSNVLLRNKSGSSYNAMSTVKYSCRDETFQVLGNETVICLYSGKWSELPRCVKYSKGISPLAVVLPVFLLPVAIFLIVVTINITLAKRARRRSEMQKRSRDFDAFVCYNFDEDNLFVFNSILPELEEKCVPPLKLLIHDRDFVPGKDISVNISNAINSCNSAIIVMSQGFINSPRCREEFAKCSAENESDSAFKLFVILMEDINVLRNVPDSIGIFFKQKTFLKKDDPKVFQKIGSYLLKTKQQNDLNEDEIVELLVDNR